MSGSATVPNHLRADARRNHAEILNAARRVVLERGPNAPLEEIAKVAGVGIGTLYRRFGDREGLLKSVVLDSLEQAKAAAERALDENESGYDALAAYLRAGLELRVAAVIPLVLDRLDLHDPELGPARDAGAEALQAIIDRGHEDGSLARNIEFGDIGTLLVRLSRPLPGPVTQTTDTELARRHLELALAGLRLAADETVGGPGRSREQISAD